MQLAGVLELRGLGLVEVDVDVEAAAGAVGYGVGEGGVGGGFVLVLVLVLGGGGVDEGFGVGAGGFLGAVGGDLVWMISGKNVFGGGAGITLIEVGGSRSLRGEMGRCSGLGRTLSIAENVNREKWVWVPCGRL